MSNEKQPLEDTLRAMLTGARDWDWTIEETVEGILTVLREDVYDRCPADEFLPTLTALEKAMCFDVIYSTIVRAPPSDDTWTRRWLVPTIAAVVINLREHNK